MTESRSASRREERKIDERAENFLPEEPKTDARLTREETSHLENLHSWQVSSAKTVIVLGKPLDF